MSKVILETNMGEITLELYEDHAPKVLIWLYCSISILTTFSSKTCKNFYELAKVRLTAAHTWSEELTQFTAGLL